MDKTGSSSEQLSIKQDKIRSELETLKANLFYNHAIYHERITLLIQILRFDILEASVNFKAKIIKPLNRIQAEKNRLYLSMIAKNEITFGASYFFSDFDNPILNGTKLGRPYCRFTLWTDPVLVEFVMKHDDEVTKQIPPLILWDKDWLVVKNKT